MLGLHPNKVRMQVEYDDERSGGALPNTFRKGIVGTDMSRAGTVKYKTGRISSSLGLTGLSFHLTHIQTPLGLDSRIIGTNSLCVCVFVYLCCLCCSTVTLWELASNLETKSNSP